MADAAEKPQEEETQAKGPEFDGVVTGKYNWGSDVGKKDADSDMGAAITKYAWSDGKKTVSIYVEMDGLDDVPEDAISSESTDSKASLSIVIGGKKRTLTLASLNDAITGCKHAKKPGKNTVVLKLEKKEVAPWHKLQAVETAGGGDEEDGGGMGGMGGMPGMGGMGGMPGMGGMGGMGGMDMASMMGGMGGMGGMPGMGGMGGMPGMGGGAGGMDLSAMMAAMGGGEGGGLGGGEGGEEGEEGGDE